MRSLWMFAFFNAWCSSACMTTSAEDSPVESAEFGVFFGGQVQERDEIPYVLDRTKQTLGFKIVLKQASPRPVLVRWEVSKPGVKPEPGAPSDPLTRRTQLFESTLAAEQATFTQHIQMEPGDGLGLWNLRVVLDERVAIDRPFMVYDPVKRRQRLAAAARLDAGR